MYYQVGSGAGAAAAVSKQLAKRLVVQNLKMREVKDFFPKAFHLTLFRGNHQNKAEMKPNWIIKKKVEFSLAERS